MWLLGWYPDETLTSATRYDTFLLRKNCSYALNNFQLDILWKFEKIFTKGYGFAKVAV